jgi:hypothetical protein
VISTTPPQSGRTTVVQADGGNHEQATIRLVDYGMKYGC